MSKFRFTLLLTTTLAFFSLETTQAAKIEILDLHKLEPHFPVMLVMTDSHSESSCRTERLSAAEEMALYECGIEKLLNVNAWDKYIGIPGQKFSLKDADGLPLKRRAREGDLIEIKLPLDVTGRTYWVRIQKVLRTEAASGASSFSIVVKPTANPKFPTAVKATDHFFSNAASNTFRVMKEKHSLTSSVNGDHEIWNVEQTRNWYEKLANVAVAHGAWGIIHHGEAKVGFQSYVWKKFNQTIANCKIEEKRCPRTSRLLNQAN
jgi:hypothetical protein